MRLLRINKYFFIVVGIVFVFMTSILIVLLNIDIEKSKKITLKASVTNSQVIVVDADTANLLARHRDIRINLQDASFNAHIESAKMTKDKNWELTILGAKGRLLSGSTVSATVIYGETSLLDSILGI